MSGSLTQITEVTPRCSLAGQRHLFFEMRYESRRPGAASRPTSPRAPGERSSPSRLFLLVLLLLACALIGCHKSRPHRVHLTWDAPIASVTSPVAGYNVYRSTISGQSYFKLASGVASRSYDDYLVVSGRTYFYVVAAVDRSGQESRYSAEIHAVIP